MNPVDFTDRKSVIRVVLAVIVLGSAGFVIHANGLIASGETNTETYSRFAPQSSVPFEERDQLVAPRDNITVFTSHTTTGSIVALSPDGRLLYYNDTRHGYFDVDPSPKGEKTVVYSTVDRLNRLDPSCDADACIRNVIERANLTTGEVTVLYSQVDSPFLSTEWHDVDRVGRNRFLVADMANDAVYIVNTSTEIVEWEWRAQNALPISGGGAYPNDWTHLNDVEYLDDGRIMVSLRNQDQVIFLEPQTGMDHNWTLGTDDNTSVLFEQHNPDYIPGDRGGPAVVVADSENNRIVEYQRRGSSWQRTWTWRDRQLQWPRDADRLPNGNTLITDTHGGRVVEVDRTGNIVWSVDVASAYEAERIKTGDESTGGQSAKALNLSSKVSVGTESASPSTTLKQRVKIALPNKLVNGAAAVTPAWFTFYDAVAISLLCLGSVTWTLLEFYWSRYTLQWPITRSVPNNDE